MVMSLLLYRGRMVSALAARPLGAAFAEEYIDMMADPLGTFSLRDKVAVITGAGGELCGHMVVALGSMGTKVAVLVENGGTSPDPSSISGIDRFLIA